MRGALTQGPTRQDGISKDLRTPTAAPEVAEDFRKLNILETEKYQQRLKKLQQWRRQARIAHAQNRTEQATDEDYFDAIQYTEEDLNALAERNQPPTVYNVTKHIVNWILGSERRMRFDYRVLPRQKRGAQGAKAKTKLLKFIQDMSKGEYERSFAFDESVKAGVGWLEVGARNHPDSPVFMKAERWRNMWFDHLGLSLDGSDWRYVFREKWVDLDVAQGLFPERESSLKVLADSVNSLYPYRPDDIAVTDNATEFDIESDLDSLFGGPFDGARERLKLIEMWYRMPERVQLMHARGDDTPYGALSGSIFRPEQPDHQYLVRGRYFETVETTLLTVRCAIWAGSTFLQDMLSPYNHLRFPFIPIFCYRRKRDNMPYGVIRDIRDPQSDLNKRRSRALFILSSNQTMYEEGAINDPIEFYEESQRPDGMMKVNKGALTAGAVKRERDNQLAMEHVELARDDERFIRDVSGVSMYGAEATKKEMSGKAILALENQSQTGSGVYFDNYFYAFQLTGEVLVSLEEQFFDQEAEYRITGDENKDEFIRVNAMGPDGRVENGIQDSKADFIISKQDFRETMRLSMLQMLSELVQSLLQSGMPEVALSLLDMVVDMMDDLPNREEIVARIRKINKQRAPDDELTPEEKAAQDQADAAAQQEQAQMSALQKALIAAELASKQAEATNKQAQALKAQVESQMKKLEGFITALEAAKGIAKSPELAEAADSLIAESQTIPTGRQVTARPGNGAEE